MMDNSVSSNGFAGSVPVVTNPPSGRTNPSSPYKGASRALGVTALLAVLAVGPAVPAARRPRLGAGRRLHRCTPRTGRTRWRRTRRWTLRVAIKWSSGCGDDASDFTIEDGVLAFVGVARL